MSIVTGFVIIESMFRNYRIKVFFHNTKKTKKPYSDGLSCSRPRRSGRLSIAITRAPALKLPPWRSRKTSPLVLTYLEKM